MNYNNAGNYSCAIDLFAGMQSGKPADAKPETAKSEQHPSSKAKAFQKTYKQVVAEANREKSIIAAKELENARARREEMIRLLSLAVNKNKPVGDPLETNRKCLDIARRIMKGAKVTIAEIRFILANAPELYFMAILFKQEGKNNDDEKTYSDEELLADSSEAGAETGGDASAGADAGAGASGSAALVS